MSQSGHLERFPEFPSKNIDPRNIDIWLPPSYSSATNESFRVIYMHDGQNLFEDSLCGFGVEWGVDETISRLSASGEIPECIVVGIWNTPLRYPEYQPQKPYFNLEPNYRKKLFDLYGSEPLSDNYLKFIVEELKPFVDKNFRTRPQRDYTFMMGSSMGGLVSIYTLCEYPEIFAGAACLSTHWVTRVDLENNEMARVMEEYLEDSLPLPGNHKIYFDYGTLGLDFYYEAHQQQVDAIFARKGFVKGKDWDSKKYEGADHNETSWSERLHIPLVFLLSNSKE